MGIGVNKDKIKYFEFILANLIKWYCERMRLDDYRAFNRNNDLSKLKILKLHFFVSAINSQSNSLLTIFDSFYAMPYGHVEGSLYDVINQNRLERYDFVGNKVIIKDPFIDNLNESFGIATPIFAEILESIHALKQENYNLIALTALDLVELSHKWVSWKIVFESARSKNKYSEKIPAEMIQNESKFFSVL